MPSLYLTNSGRWTVRRSERGRSFSSVTGWFTQPVNGGGLHLNTQSLAHSTNGEPFPDCAIGFDRVATADRTHVDVARTLRHECPVYHSILLDGYPTSLRQRENTMRQGYIVELVSHTYECRGASFIWEIAPECD